MGTLIILILIAQSVHFFELHYKVFTSPAIQKRPCTRVGTYPGIRLASSSTTRAPGHPGTRVFIPVPLKGPTGYPVPGTPGTRVPTRGTDPRSSTTKFRLCSPSVTSVEAFAEIPQRQDFIETGSPFLKEPGTLSYAKVTAWYVGSTIASFENTSILPREKGENGKARTTSAFFFFLVFPKSSLSFRLSRNFSSERPPTRTSTPEKDFLADSYATSISLCY